MNVLALDLSLVATGVARSVGDNVYTGTAKGGSLRGPERLRHLRELILDEIDCDTGIVIIEDGVVRSSAAKVLGELHGVIKVALHEIGITPTLIAPASVKKYATGKGNADKLAMLSAAVQRLGYTGSSADEVDALWMLHMARDHLGAPLVTMPAAHREALTKVEWTLARQPVGATP